MNIYYKRIKTFQSYPDNDLVETDLVYFSKGKRKFDDNVFLSVDPQIEVPERLSMVSQKLSVKKSRIKLIKI